ncbi:ATP-binding protein [Streptomyces sp. NPDC085946]|uniref:ATP-binding protein n=1 Tax=Streptomyces sp. NPDC085946 TaxID=3365744 RepID=UPI0037CF7995
MPPRVAEPISVLEAPPPAAAGLARPSFGMAVRSEPSSVQVVRRVIRAWIRCHCRLPGDQADILLVVMSELCTNAVQHGGGDAFDVRGWMPTAGVLRLEVDDKTPSASPAPGSPEADTESGRGLLLVDILVKELGGKWGFSEDGACAWCALPLPGAVR